VKDNEFVRSAIRRKVHLLFLQNIPDTLSAVLENVNNVEELQNCKRTTLYTLIKEIGFNYEKRSKNALLIERNDIILWRHSYLRKIKRFREESKDIIYLDETWVNVGQTILKEWRGKTTTTPKDAFLVGLTTGLKHLTARGPRFVIVHAGGKNGFINDAILVFLANKKGTRQTTVMR
jgi:hypothetical protein